MIVELGDHKQASYLVLGSGPPLPCFPGGPGFPALIVREDAELLVDRFRIYLADPPGTGRSTPSTNPADYDQLGHVRFYNAVRRRLGLNDVTVHGVSFGAVCALTFASLFPEATRRAIGVSTFGIQVPGLPSRIRPVTFRRGPVTEGTTSALASCCGSLRIAKGEI